MDTSSTESVEAPLGGRVGRIALGLSYVAVGVGMIYSLATGSIEAFAGVVLGVLIVTVISLYVVFRREGLMTAENGLIATFVVLAMGLMFGLSEYTTLPMEAIYGVVIVVGVLVPKLLLVKTHAASGS